MELAQKFDAKGIEAEVRKYLKGADVRGQIRATGREKRARFIEGPPTMNGPPHAGHLRGRVIKDLWYRFNTLRGMEIEFNGGWDTQGLPIELQAEKELGAAGGKSKAVEQFGVERIVEECKRIVAKYTREWIEADRLLGVSLDHEKAYRTFDDKFIEREWQVLRRAKELNAIREDYTVIAYCPSCQTSLSHAEVGQGYKEVSDPSLYYTVRLEDGNADSDTRLVVWTTMPFTLVTDAMVGVHPDEEYLHIKTDGDQGRVVLVVGKTRLQGLLEEIGAESHEVVKVTRGSEMDGLGYRHPLRDIIPGLDRMLKNHPDKYHKVVAEDFVDVNAGSGLVHIAPANGEEDIRVAASRGVAVYSPIDDEVRFTEDAGPRYAGMFVRDADRAIVEDLKERGCLVKIGRVRHSYPHCWRSGHALVWLARRGFFYDTAAIGDYTTRAAEDAEYFFEQPRNRFLGIINDRHPWCISRERIWGCPLPAWKCSDCPETTWLYSRSDIVRNSIYLPDGDGFELHKPWIDNISVRCGSCGGVNTTREDYVLDTWHNSGSAPWSSLEDSQYAEDVPVPFLTEGIDQTRGWAYTLLLENVILSNGPAAPFRAFLFQGHVLDENGQKMSKSKGNVLEGNQMLSRYPADAVRLYFMWKASPIEPLSFSTKEMMSRPYQIISTLYNLHLYHSQNSSYDKFDQSVHTIGWASGRGLLREPDRWLLSKLQGVVRTVSERNERCRFHEAARALDDYIINVFSQTYVRMTRGELWNEDGENSDRRLAIYAVQLHVLRELDVMMHPLCPFTTEYLWQSALRQERGGGGGGGGGRGPEQWAEQAAGESILLAEWPACDPGMEDVALEESFDAMTAVISACGAARMTKKLKGRWPLNEAIICVGRGKKAGLDAYADILRDQINVERLTIIETEHADATGAGHVLELAEKGMPITITAELNGKSAGPKAKQHMPELARVFGKGDPAEMARSLRATGRYEVAVQGGAAVIRLDSDDMTFGYEAADGFATAAKRAGGGGHASSSSSHSATASSTQAAATTTAAAERQGVSCTVFLTTQRNREMTARGLIKDVARRMQLLRKEAGHNPTDVLERASILGMTKEQESMISERSDELAFLVRVRAVSFEETCRSYKDEDVDGQKIRIAIE